MKIERGMKGPWIDDDTPGPLAGLRVIDASTVFAGPACARYLADFGADVIKVERPDGGDTTRELGWRDPRDGVALWWKYANRNKRCVTLDLKTDSGREALLALVEGAHVLVENFRPGTLERLGLAPEVLWARNPKLVITRVTGFGQTGPYAPKAGFATLAEAMSGYAALSGEADGPPLLPPIALTDEITGIVAAYATMVGVHAGVGQVVDVSLLESLFQFMGPLIGAYRMLGYEQPRLGAQIAYTVPRNTYRCGDGKWVAVSTTAESVAQRVMRLVGAGDDERFMTSAGRVQHRDEVNRIVGAWISARTRDDVIAAFESVEAAIAPVYTIGELAADPHVAAREMVQEIDGVPMQGVVARLSATPGSIRWLGRALGADNESVLGALRLRRARTSD